MTFLRKMEASDIARVIEIIDEHDEDDAGSAEEDFERNGVEDHFVYELDGRVIGVTGFRRVPETENTAWISWTYIHPDNCGNGYGKAMLQELIEKLRSLDARKLFVKVSNYEDPEDGKIYERALKLYEALGFELELTNLDFYDDGEDQLILGKQLTPQENAEEIKIVEEKPVIRFKGLYEIPDSDGAYTFAWEVLPKKAFFGKRSFSVLDLQLGLRSVKEQGGRKVFLTFPQNLPLIHEPLQKAGFKLVGSLADYYENGLNEMHFSHNLSNIG